VPFLCFGGEIVKTEKNTRAVLQASGQFITLNSTTTNCTTGVDTVKNGVITKFGSKCDLTFTYTWTGEGKQDEMGSVYEPDRQTYDYKQFSVALIDLSGNISIESDKVTVFNDRTAPKLGTGNLTSNDANSPITEGFTKSLNIKSTDNGEMKSDVSYSITNPIPLGSGQANITTNQAVIRADNSGNSAANFTLGTLSDERAGCTTTVGTRRVGTCEDGVYKVTTKHTDTSGNMNAGFVKSVERDTVAPAAPKGNVVFDANGYGILNVTTEQNVEILINGIRYTNSDGLGNASVKYLNPNSYLYGSTGTIPVSVRDLARNTSVTTIVKYTTPAPPKYISYCVKSGKVAFPLEKMVDAISVFNEPRTYTNTQGKTITDIHDGLDFSVPTGTKVLAAHDGVVSYGSDSYGGIGIYVNSGSFTTMYWHLSKRSVPEGYQIKQGEIIGLSGESGNVTGAHLHFGFKINGQSYSDPKIQLACEVDDSISKNGNLTLNEKLVQASFTLTDDYDQADVDKATKLLSQADNWPIPAGVWPGIKNSDYISLPLGLQYDIIKARQQIVQDRKIATDQAKFTKCMTDSLVNLKTFADPMSFVTMRDDEVYDVTQGNSLLPNYGAIEKYVSIDPSTHYSEIIKMSDYVAELSAYNCGSARIVVPNDYQDQLIHYSEKIFGWITYDNKNNLKGKVDKVKVSTANIPSIVEVRSKMQDWELTEQESNFYLIGASYTMQYRIVQSINFGRYNFAQVSDGTFITAMEEGLKLLPVTMAEVCSTAALGVSLGTGVAACTGAGIATAAISSFYIESIRSRYYQRDFSWNSVLTNTFQSSIDVATVMAMTYAGGIFVEAAMPYTMLMLKNGVTVVGTGVYKVAKRVYVVVNGVLKSVDANLGRVGQYIDLKTGQVYDTLENIRVALNFATGDVYESGGKLVIKNDKYSIAKVVDDGFGGKALSNVSSGTTKVTEKQMVDSSINYFLKSNVNLLEVDFSHIQLRHLWGTWNKSGSKFIEGTELNKLYIEIVSKISSGNSMPRSEIRGGIRYVIHEVDFGTRVVGYDVVSTGLKDINGALIYSADLSKPISKVRLVYSLDINSTGGFAIPSFYPLK
jgi:murein DD-endopeptidase MepM/ murein hydrolase activator NlpD